MLRHYRLGLGVALGLVYPVATFFGSTASAQVASDVVGTWILVSSVTDKDGARTDQFGSGAKGMLTLDADGRFMLTIIGPDLPKFASNNRTKGTDAENAAAVHGALNYFGTYTIDEPSKSITVMIEASSYPNFVGETQKRTLSVSGDELQVINAAPSGGGGVATQIWKRAK